MRTPDPSLGNLLERLADRGEATAVLVDDGEGLHKIGTAALAARSASIARALVGRGVTPDERIGLCAPNGAEWIIVRLGIAAAGAVCVPIDPLAAADELAMIVGASAMTRLFLASQQVPLLAAIDAAGLAEIVVMNGDAGGPCPTIAADVPSTIALSTLEEGALGDVTLPRLAPDRPAMMVFTSGTTGRPKYFILSYANIETNVRAIAGTGLIDGADRLLVPLPLHHVYPFVVGVLVPLWTGAVIVLPQAPQGPAIVRALQRGKATMMIGVPRLYEALVAGIEAQARARGKAAGRAFAWLLGLSVAARRRLGLRLGRMLFSTVHARFGGNLRLLVSAGAKLDAPVIWKIEGLGWALLTGYGLAETASAFTGNVPGSRRIGSEGRPLSGGAARIAGASSALPGGATAGRGDGEIELKGPSVFSGYLDNSEANAEAFSADGWFRTGDLGSIDEDGFVYVTGRVKEMIVLGGGKNVFPEDVERAYADSPYIAEIAVLERKGDLVALIVPDLDAVRAGGYTSLDDVLRVTLASKAQALASHQRLSGYAVVRDPLPRTRLGKYQRFLLPELYERALRGERRSPSPAEPSEEDAALLREPAAAAAWSLLKERYADGRLGMDASPQLDLGIDSLEWLGLGMALEAATGRLIEPERLAAAETVRELVRLVAQAPGSGDADADAGPGSLASAGRAHVEADVARWLAPRGGASRLAGQVLDGVNRVLMRTVFSLKVAGRNHLPAGGPFLLVANHASDLDPLVLAAALPKAILADVYWSGDRDRLFASAWSRGFCRAVRIFPVDEHNAAATLAMAEAVVDRGHALVWFPESWRSPDGSLQRFLPGIGALLSRRPVSVVPAHIDGTFAAMPRTRRLPRPHRVSVRFGPVIDPERLEAFAKAEPAAIAEALRDAVAALGPGQN
ncbi:MAG: AMP-binding protein [Rhodospirillales bacterium]|nr:AMP-binding protein [Rhodospirillales bacterium]